MEPARHSPAIPLPSDATVRADPTDFDGDSLHAGKTHADASSGAETAQAFPPGTKIGPYEVLRQLGKGSMGTVLAARHVELGREVALKVLAPNMSVEPESVERFRRESEAVARLDHPGIVRLYERGESGGLHYFAMELVKGTALDAVIRRERVSYVEAARIIAQSAHAIDVAHGMGILHRDLKPANILLEASGRARVTDFGLARIDRKATLTSDGTVVGTPLYLAPEVAMGERASRKSDIYSLGATLYELATGQPPYEGKEARTVMMRVLNEPPIPPADSDPRIPKDLVRIIGKAMARKPEDRYPNARALAMDLERFAQGRTLEIKGSTAAFRESTATRVWKRLLLTGSIAAAISGTVVLVIYLDIQRKRAVAEAEKLDRELKHVRATGKTETGVDLRVDAAGLHAAQDRDIRARIALKGLIADATDPMSKRSFDEILARARECEKENPNLASAMLRQALQLFPHRFDVHLELGRTIVGLEPDEAEVELTMCTVAPETPKELQLAARLERARLYRAKGDDVSLWMAAADLKLVFRGRAHTEAQKAGILADLAFALASTGQQNEAAEALAAVPAASGDDEARAALARAAIARAMKDSAAVEAEVGRAREAAVSDEVRHLIDVFAK